MRVVSTRAMVGVVLEAEAGKYDSVVVEKEEAEAEEAWREGSLSLAASWAVIEVGFSKEIPISAEDQKQCGQRRI